MPPIRRVRAAEQVELADGLCLLGAHHRVDRVGVHEHQALAGMAERVEGPPGLDERFGDLLRTGDGVDLAEIVGEVGERTLLLTSLDDGRDDVGTDVAHRAHTEPDVLTDRGEVDARGVDVRREHCDAHLAAVREIQRRLVLVVADGREQAGHVLGGVVGLEVGGPEGHQAVAGGVRLVERVAGERQNGVPQGGDRRLREAVVLHALREAVVGLVEDLLLLLTHRATQQVGLAEAVPGNLLRDLHDLLLIHDQAERVLQDVAQRFLELGGGSA